MQRCTRVSQNETLVNFQIFLGSNVSALPIRFFPSKLIPDVKKKKHFLKTFLGVCMVFVLFNKRFSNVRCLLGQHVEHQHVNITFTKYIRKCKSINCCCLVSSKFYGLSLCGVPIHGNLLSQGWSSVPRCPLPQYGIVVLE